jgi:AcrR family transcriptional regulator
MSAVKASRLSADARKALIVETALRLSDEFGPELVTTERIASAMGLTQPAIFRHFPKKELIWTAVAEYLGNAMMSVWDRAEAGTDAPAAAVKLVAMAHVRLLAETPGIIAILFSRELHFNNEILRGGLARNQKFFRAKLEASVKGGIERGVFRSGLDAPDAALLVIAIIQSVALRWSLVRRQFDLADEVSRLLDMQLAGFR